MRHLMPSIRGMEAAVNPRLSVKLGSKVGIATWLVCFGGKLCRRNKGVSS